MSRSVPYCPVWQIGEEKPFEFLCEVKMRKIHFSLQKSELLVQKVTDANWWHCWARSGKIKIATFCFWSTSCTISAWLSLLPSCCSGIVSKKAYVKKRSPRMFLLTAQKGLDIIVVLTLRLIWYLQWNKQSDWMMTPWDSEGYWLYSGSDWAVWMTMTISGPVNKYFLETQPCARCGLLGVHSSVTGLQSLGRGTPGDWL